MSDSTQQPASFEEAYAMLEEYTRRMAAPDIALEESIDLYERSVRLIDFCQKRIEQVTLRVEMLENEKTQQSEETVNE